MQNKIIKFRFPAIHRVGYTSLAYFVRMRSLH